MVTIIYSLPLAPSQYTCSHLSSDYDTQDGPHFEYVTLLGSWNSGMCCMSFFILIHYQHMYEVKPRIYLWFLTNHKEAYCKYGVIAFSSLIALFFKLSQERASWKNYPYDWMKTRYMRVYYWLAKHRTYTHIAAWYFFALPFCVANSAITSHLQSTQI